MFRKSVLVLISLYISLTVLMIKRKKQSIYTNSLVNKNDFWENTNEQNIYQTWPGRLYTTQ